MSQAELYKIKQEVKEQDLAKMRNQWFRAYRKSQSVKAVCREFGIHRSQFYYWKKRRDLVVSGKGKGYARSLRLLAYSRKPHTSPKSYSPEVIQLTLKIRRRTNKGAEYIWFLLRDKYGTFVSVTGIYKVLKRAGMIRIRKGGKKPFIHYEAPKYLPGDKVQMDVKYVKLEDM